MTNPASYILSKRNEFKTRRIDVADNWQWNAYEHIRRSFLMKNSKFFGGTNELGKRPYKNIIRPILNVSYRSEGFDVKDINPYVVDSDYYHLSMIVRKYHPKWAQRNHIDQFIDEVVESYVDYGLAVAKNVGDVRPECVPLMRFAFFDQRDFTAGPSCEEHDYTIDQLMDQKGKWFDDEIERAIIFFKADKERKEDSMKVYELRGTLPNSWLNDGEDGFSEQVHIYTYYKGTDNKYDQGICLYKGKDKKRYKVIKRDDIFNRACGWGGVEELFEAQVWTNYSIQQMREMLDVATLMVFQTQDPAFKSNNSIMSLKKGQIITTADNSPLTQVRAEPVNIQNFRNWAVEWDNSARLTGSASDPQLGLNPTSGTPLGTTELVTSEGTSMHKYRMGKIAEFVREVYSDWVLKFMTDELDEGRKFIEELSLDELRTVAEASVTNHVNEEVKKAILRGEEVTEEQKQAFFEFQVQEFMKRGQSRFFELMKGEISKIPIEVMIDVAGKHKNLPADTTKLSNIFREIIVNPQGFMAAMRIPAIAKTFNRILEFSGMDQVNFGDMPRMAEAAEQPVEAVGGNPVTEVSGIPA